MIQLGFGSMTCTVEYLAWSIFDAICFFLLSNWVQLLSLGFVTVMKHNKTFVVFTGTWLPSIFRYKWNWMLINSGTEWGVNATKVMFQTAEITWLNDYPRLWHRFIPRQHRGPSLPTSILLSATRILGISSLDRRPLPGPSNQIINMSRCGWY